MGSPQTNRKVRADIVHDGKIVQELVIDFFDHHYNGAALVVVEMKPLEQVNCRMKFGALFADSESVNHFTGYMLTELN